MDTGQTVFSGLSNITVAEGSAAVHHILSGSFRSLSLFLLAFSPLHRTLSLVQEVDAFGPHQYITVNPRRDRLYTTSWAQSPVLCSWEIERPDNEAWRVNHINTVPITATSSYITVPPPYTHIYSAGGPTGEVHIIDPATGGFGEKLQQFLFVSEDKLESADKTPAALRYGAHAIEFSPAGHAFVPVLGTDSIEMFNRNIATGLLTHISTIPSPRGPDAHDGPRHLKIHPNGKVLYCITEHTNFIDAYSITSTSLRYITSRSLLPHNISQIPRFRGDTLLLVPATQDQPTPRALFATTRGSTTADKGWLSVFSLDEDGLFSNAGEYHETPTSGGKANALDLLPKLDSDSSSVALWIILTDDDDEAASPEGGNGIHIFEWDGWGKGVKKVVGWPVPGISEEESTHRMAGGSHAIWLD